MKYHISCIIYTIYIIYAPNQIKPTFWSLGLRLKISTLRLKLTLSPERIIAVSQYNTNVTNYIFQNTRLMQIGQQSTSILGKSNNAPPPDSTPNETQSLLMKEFCWHCQWQWFLFFILFAFFGWNHTIGHRGWCDSHTYMSQLIALIESRFPFCVNNKKPKSRFPSE